MKVLLLCGSHPRHSAIANALADAGVLAGLVVENRLAHVPQAPSDIADELKALFDLHFEKRAKAESKFFGQGSMPTGVDRLDIEREQLNTHVVHAFIKKTAPDLLLSYGVHMLSEETLGHAPGETWNIHGGLSPWYRGVITHFWPSYMLEPQMTGMTVHNLTQKLDGGDIVHQNSAPLVKGDGVHDLACRAVKGLADELPQLVNMLQSGETVTKNKQKTSGKLWVSKDWRPEHLRVIYGCFDDRIVDRVLDGTLSGKMPKLYRQF